MNDSGGSARVIAGADMAAAAAPGVSLLSPTTTRQRCDLSGGQDTRRRASSFRARCPERPLLHLRSTVMAKPEHRRRECPRVVLLSSASSQHHVCACRCLILQFHAPEPVCQRAHKTVFSPADANRLRGDRRRQTRESEVKKSK